MERNTREAILDAAQKLFARFGYKKTAVDEIAKEAGIGKGTVYLYFRSKEEIALAVVDKVNGAIQNRIREIARQSAPPEVKLRKMLVARVMIRFDGIQGYADSVEDFMIQGRQTYMDWRKKMNQAEAEIFCETLIEGRALGRFHVEDALATAHAILVATTALMPFDLARTDLAKRGEVEETAMRIADLMLHGIVNSGV
jgi:AcrR family transcriptional regulator